jgi:hypothetical protein
VADGGLWRVGSGDLDLGARRVICAAVHAAAGAPVPTVRVGQHRPTCTSSCAPTHLRLAYGHEPPSLCLSLARFLHLRLRLSLSLYVCVWQLVTAAVQRSGVTVQTDSFRNTEIRVVSTVILYPVHWRKLSLQPAYEKRVSELAWTNMKNKNTAIHLWSKPAAAAGYRVATDSLVQRVLRSNCDVCLPEAFKEMVLAARARLGSSLVTAAPTLPPTLPPTAPPTELPTEPPAAADDADGPPQALAADGDGDGGAHAPGDSVAGGDGGDGGGGGELGADLRGGGGGAGADLGDGLSGNGGGDGAESARASLLESMLDRQLAGDDDEPAG